MMLNLALVNVTESQLIPHSPALQRASDATRIVAGVVMDSVERGHEMWSRCTSSVSESWWFTFELKPLEVWRARKSVHAARQHPANRFRAQTSQGRGRRGVGCLINRCLTGKGVVAFAFCGVPGPCP